MRDWMVRARKAAKLTQAELAQEIGVTQRAVAAYESGERTPSPAMAKNLEKAIGIPWTRFYEEDEP